MRFCNYVTLAAILVAALLIPLKIQSSEVDTITDVKQSYSNAMETAADDAMESAVESDHGDDVDLNKDHIIDKFYHTLFINLGCPNDTIKQNAVKAYIPVTVLVARDGFYVNYSTTVTTSNGDKIITKNWSKKYRLHIQKRIVGEFSPFLWMITLKFMTHTLILYQVVTTMIMLKYHLLN